MPAYCTFCVKTHKVVRKRQIDSPKELPSSKYSDITECIDYIGNDMDIAYPLIIYFDASCRLCNSEMQNIRAHDTQNQLILIDCSAEDFDDTVCKVNNIRVIAMMNRLHVQDANGQWLIGVAAFELIYQTVGMTFIAKLWGSSITRPLAERLYPWVVKHRYIFSAIGLPELISLWSGHAARRADKASRTCSEGRCSAKE